MPDTYRLDQIIERLAELGRVVSDHSATLGRYGDSIERIEEDIYNHGRDGIKTILTKHVAAQTAYHESAERYRAEREAQEAKLISQTTVKQNLMLILIAIATLIITALGIFVTWVSMKHTSLDTPAIFHSETIEKVYAFIQPAQDSALPHPITR